MADLSTAEFEERIRMARAFSESTARSLATVPNKGIALMTLAQQQATIACLSIQRGRRDDARKAFARASGYLLDLTATSPTTAPCGSRKSAIEFALLSGDVELESRCLETGLPESCADLGRFVEPYLRALHALALKNQEAARRSAVQLSQVSVEEAQKVKYYPYLGDVVSAILEKSEPALCVALGKQLERHIHYSKKGHLRGSEAGLVCTPAAALAVLASRFGLRPVVEERSRKVELKFRVSALETWEGKPTKGLFFETPVDVLPLEFLG